MVNFMVIFNRFNLKKKIKVQRIVQLVQDLAILGGVLIGTVTCVHL